MIIISERKILEYAEEFGYVVDVSADEELEEIISDEDYLKKWGR